MTAINFVLPWQEKNWQLLNSYITQKRIPQALLITGTNGLGKYNLAKQFAFSLLCSKPQENGQLCGFCRSCQLIKADTHPDLIHIKPLEDKKSISISQIRQVVNDTYLKPQFDAFRILIINSADLMTVAAANAFLKCLEEPSERTIFVLITDKLNKLPATIISRCQKLSVTIPEKEILYAWLSEQGINNNQETLLNLMRGSILSAQHLTNENLLRQRTDCFNDWLRIANRSNHPAQISEKWLKFSETDIINWLISWIVDLIKCTNSIKPQSLTNQDLIKPLQNLSQQLELKKLYEIYDKLLKSRQLIGTQINVQMMIEEILVQWQELNRSN